MRNCILKTVIFAAILLLFAAVLGCSQSIVTSVMEQSRSDYVEMTVQLYKAESSEQLCKKNAGAAEADMAAAANAASTPKPTAATTVQTIGASKTNIVLDLNGHTSETIRITAGSKLSGQNFSFRNTDNSVCIGNWTGGWINGKAYDLTITAKKVGSSEITAQVYNTTTRDTIASVRISVTVVDSTPTATPKRTNTPKPTATPKRTNTPKPTATPKRTNTPKPTATPKRTNTPKPTATPKRTNKPTATPRRTNTPKPTATPKRTNKPTATPKTNRKLVADSITGKQYIKSLPKSSVQVQDPMDYFQGILKYQRIDSGDNFEVFSSYEEGAFAAVEAYVKALTDGSYNLKVVDKYSKYYEASIVSMAKTFFSWSISYTGTKSVSTVSDPYTNKKSAVVVYGTVTHGSNESVDVKFSFAEEFELTDLGLRKNGNIKIGPSGKSSTAALYRNADGSYETSDGRLKASLNHPMLLLDGEEETGANVLYGTLGSSSVIQWDNYDENGYVHFLFKASGVKQGDVYTLYDLRGEVGNAQPCLSSHRDGDWFRTSFLSDRDSYEDATVRVFVYEKKKLAVVYLYAVYAKGIPKTIESLAVVDLSKETYNQAAKAEGVDLNSSTDSGKTTTVKHTCTKCRGSGEITCTTCGGSGWEVRMSTRVVTGQGKSHVRCAWATVPGAIDTTPGEGLPPPFSVLFRLRPNAKAVVFLLA